MAGPITWRNVGSTVRGTGGDLLQGAQDSMTAGFGALEKALNKRNQGQKANFETGQKNLTADYMDQVQGAQSAEELQALRNNEGLQTIRDQLGGDYRTQVRGAIDNRESGIMEQTEARQEFGDGQNNRDLRGDAQRIRAAAYAGDETALAQAAELGMLDDGEFLDSVGGAQNQAFTQDMSEQRVNQGWSQDDRAERTSARQAELHDFAMGQNQRTVDNQVEQEQVDGIMGKAYERATNLGEGETATDIYRALNDSLVQVGLSPQEVSEKVTSFDAAMTQRLTATSGADSALNTEQMARLDTKYDAGNNEFIPGPSQGDPATEANNVLQEFSVDGELLGSSNPDFREDLTIQAGNALRQGVVITSGGQKMTVPVTPAILRATLNGVSDDAFDFDKDIDEALRDYIEDSDGLIEKVEQARLYGEERKSLLRQQARNTQTPYMTRTN